MLDRAKLGDKVNSSYNGQLLLITDETPDDAVAMLIARAMTEREQARFRFDIDHDVRGPKYEACPLRYDWQKKDKVGIDTAIKSTALHWLHEAALKGFKISEVDLDHREFGSIYSVALCRQRAKYHQRPRGTDDDDIPF